jgi:plasmid stabilization system protein ParE
MPELANVRITGNFARNLEDIESYFAQVNQPKQFESLLDQLFDTIIPNLQQFPLMGKDFLAELPGSVEGITTLQKIKAKMSENASIRQYTRKDYLVLYWHKDQEIALLAVKHHKQLYFYV